MAAMSVTPAEMEKKVILELKTNRSEATIVKVAANTNLNLLLMHFFVSQTETQKISPVSGQFDPMYLMVTGWSPQA